MPDNIEPEWPPEVEEIYEGLQKPILRKTSWTLAELYDIEFPEPNWIIPGLIQEGLVLLAGRPKIGKSWLLLQIACGVATGGKLFDKDITQGEVLYLALEDNARRIKDRSQKMGIPRTAPIRFEFNWKPMHNGGIDNLYAAIETNPYRLVVIDTLARSLPGVNHNDEQPIGQIMEQLQTMAIGHNLTIMPADHTRKANGMFADPIDDVMGNTSKSRAIDQVLAFYTESGKAGATLRGRGRDIEEIDMAVLFDPATYSWQYQGSSEAFRLTEMRKTLLDALRTTGKTQVSPLIKMTGIDSKNIYKYLNELVNAGKAKLERIDGKLYYEVKE